MTHPRPRYTRGRFPPAGVFFLENGTRTGFPRASSPVVVVVVVRGWAVRARGTRGLLRGWCKVLGCCALLARKKKKKLCEAPAFHGTPRPLAKASPWVGFGRGIGARSPPGDAGGDGLRVAEQAEGRCGLPATSGVFGEHSGEQRRCPAALLALGLRYRG